jgi:hypothetical protein
MRAPAASLRFGSAVLTALLLSGCYSSYQTSPTAIAGREPRNLDVTVENGPALSIRAAVVRNDSIFGRYRVRTPDGWRTFESTIPIQDVAVIRESRLDMPRTMIFLGASGASLYLTIYILNNANRGQNKKSYGFLGFPFGA